MMKKLSDICRSEFSRYILAGLSTTAINAVLYTILLLFGVRYYFANLAAIGIAKVYAYVINKYYVYCSVCHTKKELYSEVWRFFVCRGGTGLLDYLSVVFLVGFLDFSAFYSKYVVLIGIVFLNYYLGKHFVFTARGSKS